jgi:hypothetical protein
MAKNQRTFADGINEMNGYTINVVRFVGAQQVSETSRIAAKHWGTITTPTGEVIDMGESGMTVTQIKKIIGGETRTYNRGESGTLKKLESAKRMLESLGMATDDIDAKILAEKARIEEEKNRIDNSAEIKKLEKEIKKLEKLLNQLNDLGVSTADVDAKISDLNSQIDSLR